jgi:hypothetical protein
VAAAVHLKLVAVLAVTERQLDLLLLLAHLLP